MPSFCHLSPCLLNYLRVLNGLVLTLPPTRRYITHTRALRSGRRAATMILRNMSKRQPLSSNPKLGIILIISVVAGTAIILSLTCACLRVLYQRRHITRQFQDACSRDPHLTWAEFERRVRLTRSRLLFEEELQRSNMIRKSQQSRASDITKDNNNACPSVQEVAAPVQRYLPAVMMRHGRSRSEEIGMEEGVRPPLRELVSDWRSAEASVERTWQLLHGKKSPSPSSRGLLWSEDDEDAPRRPPTVRLKTPPLLSHPLFKDGGAVRGHGRRHMSLPMELTRANTRTPEASSIVS